MKSSKARKAIIAAMGLGVALVAAMVPATPQAIAQSVQPTIEGVWRVTRMGVNCQTGEVRGSFPAIMQFGRDGSYMGYAVSPGGTPANGGNEYGTWKREPGRQSYSVRFLGNGYDDSGAFDGSAEITIKLELADAGDAFGYTSKIDFLDTNGSLLFSLCGKAVGTRFE